MYTLIIIATVPWSMIFKSDPALSMTVAEGFNGKAACEAAATQIRAAKPDNDIKLTATCVKAKETF